MYGLEDLLLHIMYVNKRENLEAVRCVSISQVLLFTLASCYKQGHNIQYDYLFEKSRYGAKVDYRLIKSKYKDVNRRLNLDHAKCLKSLEDDAEVNHAIIRLIKLDNEDFTTLPKYLTHSKSYQKDIADIKKIDNLNSHFKTYPYWTKQDILELLIDSKDLDMKIDNRIPVEQEIYSVMYKFLKLDDYSEETESFTKDEIMIIHDMPDHLIRSIEENGCYCDPKLDKN